jgi:glyoxylase-like metal-dependent hydrolase (beta-lactamase superfamily II)
VKVEFVVNRIFTSRTYILSTDDAEGVWLVDCGDVDKVLEMIGHRSIKGVLLSHAHYDHIYGLPQLMSLFPDAIIYTNAFGKEALANDRINMSRYHEDSIIVSSEKVLICGEGAVISIFDGVEAVVYETPGHNPSCLTFDIENYLFTGDAYIPGVAVVTNLPKGDKVLAAQSYIRIETMTTEKIVCPGHEVS